MTGLVTAIVRVARIVWFIRSSLVIPKTLLFIPSTNKCFNHPHAGQVLLHHGVQVIELFLDLPEQREALLDHPHQQHQHQRREYKQQQGQARAGQDSHDDAANQHPRRADHSPEHQSHHLTHLGDVVGQACDQLPCFQLVQVAKRERLRLAKEGAAQISPESLCGQLGEYVAADPSHDADQGIADHQQAGIDDHGHIELGDALVDNALHHPWLHQVHNHFEGHQAGASKAHIQ